MRTLTLTLTRTLTLPQIFSVAGNQLFHAYALSRLYTISKGLKTPPGPEEMQALASRAVLAALAIPPANPVLDLNLLEYDLEHEKKKRMAQMLSFPPGISRALLVDELKAKGVLDAATPEVKSLFALTEATFFPLDIAHKAKPLLESIKGTSALEQYDESLRRLVGLRVLQQMERVYLTVKITHVTNAICVLTWPGACYTLPSPAPPTRPTEHPQPRHRLPLTSLLCAPLGLRRDHRPHSVGGEA